MPKSDNLYYYRAKVLRVIDGDTVHVDIDKGFHERQEVRLRILGVNAAEVHSPDPKERELAQLAKTALAELVEGKEVIIRTQKSDSFGRYLASIWVGDLDVGECLLGKSLVRAFVQR